jgi:hypothetical protein
MEENKGGGKLFYLAVKMPDGSWKPMDSPALNELIGELRRTVGGTYKRPGKGGTRRTDDMHRG